LSALQRLKKLLLQVAKRRNNNAIICNLSDTLLLEAAVEFTGIHVKVQKKSKNID